MLNQTQFAQKPRLQWSLLLAVLLGVCSLSAPHLLSHAHAHHNAASTRGGSSHRSRSGSNGANGEHESDASGAISALDPHTPGHVSAAVAVVPATPFVPVQWTVLEAVTPQDELFASLLAASPTRGRAPPVA